MADVYVNALTTISTEPTTTDSVVCVNRNTNEGQIIDYNLLADKILEKLSSKTFSSLSTSSKLLPGAINELDSDVASLNSSAFKGRGVLPVGTTDAGLITLTPGAYLVSGDYSWLPSGAGKYGTLVSFQTDPTGAAGYGFVLYVTTTHQMYIRHHSGSTWHNAWKTVVS